MRNAAYDKEYQLYRQEQESVFRTDYLQQEETVMLSPDYALIKRFYYGIVGQYPVQASENELLDHAKTKIFTWRNINQEGEFHKIIEHSNGSKYMIFRIDLYGYSVLNLTTMQAFHFIPSDSFPSGETFIWVDVFYNAINNILAVSGCYWAAPYGTLLLDFSKPMEEPGVWFDLHEHFGSGYDPYNDIDFVEWQGTDIILSALDNQTEKAVTLSLSADQYIHWLNEK